MLQKTRHGFYTFSAFLKFPELICGISTRRQGNLKGSESLPNFKKFIKKLGPNFDFVQFKQIHGSKVVRVERKMTNNILPDCDGGVTKERNLLLSVFVADCLPVLIYDPVKKIIGIAHAGWRGIKLEIGKELIRQIKTLGSKPSNLFVGVGPGICGKCYEVGQDVALQFDKRFLEKRNGKILLDLEKAVVGQLINAGVKKENIEHARICVYKDKNFFSARREDKNARIAVLIGMK